MLNFPLVWTEVGGEGDECLVRVFGPEDEFHIRFANVECKVFTSVLSNPCSWRTRTIKSVAVVIFTLFTKKGDLGRRAKAQLRHTQGRYSQTKHTAHRRSEAYLRLKVILKGFPSKRTM